MSTTNPPTFNFTFSPSLSPFNTNPQNYLSAHANGKYEHLATGSLVFTTTTPTHKAPRILLLQRSAHDSMPNLWEIPGGACDDTDATVLHAAARELFEEAGLLAKYVRGVVGDPHFFSSRSGKRICKFSFVVEVEGDREVVLDSKEHQRFVWASEEELKAEEGARVSDVQVAFTTREQREIVLAGFEFLKDS